MAAMQPATTRGKSCSAVPSAPSRIGNATSCPPRSFPPASNRAAFTADVPRSMPRKRLRAVTAPCYPLLDEEHDVVAARDRRGWRGVDLAVGAGADHHHSLEAGEEPVD